MPRFVFVMIGGSLGALLRYGVSGWLGRYSARLPYGTLAVNMAGSFLIGLILSYGLYSHELDPRWRVFLTAGFLGAFTTFSTFSYETLELLLENSLGLAALNIGLNLVLGLSAVWSGYLLGKAL